MQVGSGATLVNPTERALAMATSALERAGDLRLFDDWQELELKALELLKLNCPPEGYYVAFSGGKDSTVMFDLVKRAKVKYDAHYNFTTVDPPAERLPQCLSDHPHGAVITITNKEPPYSEGKE